MNKEKRQAAILNAVFLAAIVSLPLTWANAAPSQEPQNQNESAQQRSVSADHLSDLVHQSRIAEQRYAHLQKNGTYEQAQMARQARNSANQAVAEEMSHMSGIPDQQLMEMHNSGMSWGAIEETMGTAGGMNKGQKGGNRNMNSAGIGFHSPGYGGNRSMMGGSTGMGTGSGGAGMGGSSDGMGDSGGGMGGMGGNGGAGGGHGGGRM